MCPIAFVSGKQWYVDMCVGASCFILGAGYGRSLYLLCNFQLVYMLMAKSEALLPFVYAFSIWVDLDLSPV